ncbi:hypothetical protein HQ865_13800 [Mucilaginibacter mali]|uniref:Lipid/polyisoprenoid-binding YceI-like domain-containing protein n=1 Tax=Mucilaginibacter mali TaxID=2740462 RepID=A0A7D4UBJ5_9SPHI|nr:hypothetical protein [Mucilaginibacter mali]QKJ30778.1 hypothetical protein HQ865_13800 [Mucilaginibacter mali]
MKTLFSILTFVLITTFASAQNPNIKRIGQTTFSVGAYDHPFRFERVTPPLPPALSINPTDAEKDAALQATINATITADWATCIMMVLNYNGLNVQVDQILNLNSNRAAASHNSPQDLMFAINRTSPHDWGADSRIYTSTATLDPDVIFDELSAGRPLILGTGAANMEGRAFVLTAMTYTIKFDANGQQTGITPQTVTIRDPWPQAIASRVVNWADFVPLTASLYTVKVEFKK